MAEQTQAVSRRLQWGFVAVFVVVCILFHTPIFGALPAMLALPVLDMMLFGGFGGVLFAIRSGDLDSPRFVLLSAAPGGPVDDRYVIRLGWIADVLHGFAGAVVVFLILPDMARQAGEVFGKLTANPGQSTIDGGMVSGFLQVIGVALLGGFAGKALIQRATDALLQKKVDEAIAGLGEREADSAALALVGQQMNPAFPDPDPTALRLALTRATPNGQIRALESVTTRLQTLKADVAGNAVPVLKAFLDLDSKTFGQIAWTALADAHELLNHLPDAVRAINEAIQAAREAHLPEGKLARLTERRKALREKLPSGAPLRQGD